MVQEQVSLADLKDIHLPLDVSIFPIAIGWKILVLLAIISVLAFKLYNYYKLKSIKRYALMDLEKISKKEASYKEKIIEISKILKRIAIVKYKSKNVANLYGKEWIDFLKNKVKNKNLFSSKLEDFFQNHRFAPQKDNEQTKDIYESFIKDAKDWIRKNS
jgi:hypothetical protein